MTAVVVSIAVYAVVALVAWWVMVERAVRRGELRGGALMDSPVPTDGLLALLGFVLLVLVVAVTHPLRAGLIALKAAFWPVTAVLALCRRTPAAEPVDVVGAPQTP